MSSSIAYLTLGMLAGFLFLIRHPESRIESFRELRFPMRTRLPLTVNSLSGEQAVSNPAGVLIDQGQQAIRVGTDSIQMFTHSSEALRLTNGKVLIGESDTITPINSVGQQDELTLKGSIVMTGGKVLEQKPSSVTAYFYDQQQGEYYDYGGIKIMDRSYEPGNTIYLLGEWIQLSVSSAIMLRSLTLRCSTSIPNRYISLPHVFHLVGSLDGSKWFLITSQLSQSSRFTNDFLTFPLTNSKPYTHYRVIFTQLSGPTNTQIGPLMQIQCLQLTDTSGNNLPPSPMQFNTQKIGSITYTLSSSIQTGNVASFVQGDIQSLDSTLVGLTRNSPGNSLEADSYTALTFPANNDYYLPGDAWTSSGLATTLALVTTTPFNSAIGMYVSYHGSYPVECMRMVNNGGTAMVGIGITQPKSNLSVLGSFDTSFMSADVLGTKVAINSTSANYIHMTSGISAGTGFSQILFHSSDGAGTGTNNYYDASIISSGGVENQNNSGRLALTAEAISFSANRVLYPIESKIGIGLSNPIYSFQIETPFNYAGLTHSSGAALLQTVIQQNLGVIGMSSQHDLGLMAGGLSTLFVSRTARVGVGISSPIEKLHLIGNQLIQNGSLFIGEDSVTNCVRLFKSGTGSFLDFADNFFIRKTQAVNNYITALSVNAAGYVGIGTTDANRQTAGGTRCFGLDIYGNSGQAVGLLRLSNVFSGASLAKGGSIQFTTRHASGDILQAQISGRSINDAGSRGVIDFWIKTGSSGSDGTDMLVTGFVDQNGVCSGTPSMTRYFHLAAVNSVGKLWCGVAGQAGDYSTAAAAGDAVIRTELSSRNLLLQSGGEFPAIYIRNLDTSGNSRFRQSRVGVGSTTPEGLFTVYRQPQTILSTDVVGDNSIDRYSMYVSSGNITNQKAGQNLSAPSIYLESGRISYGGATAGSARLELTGGRNNNGAVSHGLVNFYTAMRGDTPVVTIGNPASDVTGSLTYFGYNTTYLNTAAMSIASYAIYARGDVVTTNTFVATSDQRIKKNIEPIQKEWALDLLNRIHICQYEMRDASIDPGRKIGVIAQQVREVLPEAVRVGQSDYVADLLAYVERVHTEPTGSIITLFSDVRVGEGTRVKLVNDMNETREAVVVSVLNQRVLTVSEALDPKRSWMLFGTLQEGILAVDKPMLGMLAISAIQSLSEKVQQLEKMVNAQQNLLEKIMQRL